MKALKGFEICQLINNLSKEEKKFLFHNYSQKGYRQFFNYLLSEDYFLDKSPEKIKRTEGHISVFINKKLLKTQINTFKKEFF